MAAAHHNGDPGGERRAGVRPLHGPGEIAEDEASLALAETYARLRLLLDAPFVPTVYRRLAAIDERYLADALDALAPLIGGADARRFAAATCARAAEAAAELDIPPLRLGSAKREVLAIIDRYNAANPRSLLFVTALSASAERNATTVAEGASGVMEDVPHSAAPTDTRPILDEIRVLHGDCTVPGMWRELSRFPAVLRQAWAALRHTPGQAAFAQAQADIAMLARAEVQCRLAAQLPTAQQRTRNLLRHFKGVITAMIVEIECLRAAAR